MCRAAAKGNKVPLSGHWCNAQQCRVSLLQPGTATQWPGHHPTAPWAGDNAMPLCPINIGCILRDKADPTGQRSPTRGRVMPYVDDCSSVPRCRHCSSLHPTFMFMRISAAIGLPTHRPSIYPSGNRHLLQSGCDL